MATPPPTITPSLSLGEQFAIWQADFLHGRLRYGYPISVVALLLFAALDIALIPDYRSQLVVSYTIMLTGVGLSFLFFVSPYGRQRPDIAMVTLGFAYLVLPQIWVTLGGRVIYSASSWLLTILGMTVLLPILVRRHILLQASTLLWHVLFNFQLTLVNQPQNEGGVLWAQIYSILQLVVICVLADVSVYLYEGLQRRSFYHQRTLEQTNIALEQAQADTLEANRAKNAFLASMSHELLTPLNAVLGYSEILVEEADELDKQSVQKDARNILMAGQQLQALIENVLALARLEAGAQGVILRRVDLAVELPLLTERFRPVLAQRGNEFAVVWNTAVSPPIIETDAQKLNQILINLLLNANKFTSEGHISLTIQDHPTNPSQIQFRIADNGPGVDLVEIRHQLNEYYQPERAGTHSKKGVGLGLVICQQYCHLLGGEMEVEANEPHGAVFYISLPRGI
jgi:signal transduction histidine kinase